MRAGRDFGLLKSVPGNKVGATLTFYDDDLSKKWEPRAALPGWRVTMLSIAKFVGLETWASIEPVIHPEQSLKIMERAMLQVDEFKIGKLNHHLLAKEIDWKDFARRAQDLMEKHNKKYMFKQDLLEAI
jgi:DNA repair photolyase